jgi:hypothetical protein
VKAFRVEVTPGLNAGGDQAKDVWVTLRPDAAPNRRDTSQASTRCLPRTQPDLLVRREYDVRFVGDNVYNTTGSGQTKAQETDPDLTAENATLESAEHVMGPWQTVLGVTGNRHSVAVRSGHPAQFFRLRLE